MYKQIIAYVLSSVCAVFAYPSFVMQYTQNKSPHISVQIKYSTTSSSEKKGDNGVFFKSSSVQSGSYSYSGSAEECEKFVQSVIAQCGQDTKFYVSVRGNLSQEQAYALVSRCFSADNQLSSIDDERDSAYSGKTGDYTYEYHCDSGLSKRDQLYCKHLDLYDNDISDRFFHKSQFMRDKDDFTMDMSIYMKDLHPLVKRMWEKIFIDKKAVGDRVSSRQADHGQFVYDKDNFGMDMSIYMKDLHPMINNMWERVCLDHKSFDDCVESSQAECNDISSSQSDDDFAYIEHTLRRIPHMWNIAKYVRKYCGEF